MNYYYSNKKRKLVIYQHGLGDNEERLAPTVSNVIRYGFKHDIEYPKHIKGATLDEAINEDVIISDITDQLNDLVAFCNENADLNVHVRTYLGGSTSIEDQKNQLINIITYLKSRIEKDRDIILIGHSQGGLVNLEAATEIPGLISDMISINTPYSPNSYVIKLSLILYIIKTILKNDSIAQNANNVIDNLFGSNDGNKSKDFIKKILYDEYFEQKYGTLGKESYFDDLKSRWNALSTRPNLYTVASASAVDCQKLLFFIPLKILTDGLVDLSEQTDISHSSTFYLLDSTLPCRNVFEKNTIDSNNFLCYTCNEECPLSKINTNKLINDLILDVLNGIRSKFSGEPVSEDVISKSNDFLATLAAIISKQELTVTDADCVEIYNTFASPYSHQNSMNLRSLATYIIGLIG